MYFVPMNLFASIPLLQHMLSHIFFIQKASYLLAHSNSFLTEPNPIYDTRTAAFTRAPAFTFFITNFLFLLI